MSLLDAFRTMTPGDVIEALVEDPSLLGAWQEEIAGLKAESLSSTTTATGAEFLAAADALSLTADLDELEAAPTTPTLRLVVVPSSQLRGVLSLRPADADGQPAGHLKTELNDAGFEPGDVVEVVLVRRATAGGAR